MRIAVVGAGAAGLSCAWLLGSTHEVVCYEALPVIGGNGRSEKVDILGEAVTVSPGATFLPPAMSPIALRLMRQLGVPLETLSTQFTLCDEGGAVRFVSPSLQPLRLSVLARPGSGRDLVGWTKLLLAGRRLERADDWATTWGSLRSRLGLSEPFLGEIADPVLASLWGVTIEDLTGISARAALGPATPQQPTKMAGKQRPFGVAGGMGVWLAMLAEQAGRLTVRTSTPVGEIVRIGPTDGFRVTSDSGDDEFDRVVLATSPWTAAALAPRLLEPEAARALSALPETPCVIAIHGDPSHLPERAGERSNVSMVSGPGRAQLTTTAGTVKGRPLYRSWVTWSERQPDPCYARFEFRHVRPDPVLFEVQRELVRWRQASGLHFAGSWVAGWDCHETAVASAVLAASEIDPTLPRLALLRRRR